jgi:hypothetical protein
MNHVRRKATIVSAAGLEPASIVADIPIVQWKLLQTSDRRLRLPVNAPAAAAS